MTTPPTSAASAPPSSAPAPDVVLPASPVPTTEGDCPYLAATDVAAINGQRVAAVLVDTPTGGGTPACTFTGLDGAAQLSVWVLRAADAATARAVVDRAAPVATTDPASSPPGWSGGRSGGGTGPLGGAVHAVANGSTAVVVTTNQAQSLKAQRVTEQVVATLGLP